MTSKLEVSTATDINEDFNLDGIKLIPKNEDDIIIDKEMLLKAQENFKKISKGDQDLIKETLSKITSQKKKEYLLIKFFELNPVIETEEELETLAKTYEPFIPNAYYIFKIFKPEHKHLILEYIEKRGGSLRHMRRFPYCSNIRLDVSNGKIEYNWEYKKVIPMLAKCPNPDKHNIWSNGIRDNDRNAEIILQKDYFGPGDPDHSSFKLAANDNSFCRMLRYRSKFLREEYPHKIEDNLSIYKQILYYPHNSKNFKGTSAFFENLTKEEVDKYVENGDHGGQDVFVIDITEEFYSDEEVLDSILNGYCVNLDSQRIKRDIKEDEYKSIYEVELSDLRCSSLKQEDLKQVLSNCGDSNYNNGILTIPGNKDFDFKEELKKYNLKYPFKVEQDDYKSYSQVSRKYGGQWTNMILGINDDRDFSISNFSLNNKHLKMDNPIDDSTEELEEPIKLSKKKSKKSKLNILKKFRDLF